MKIVIIGGTGHVGSKLTSKLKALGQDVLPASRSTGVNTITGEGLSDALRGAETVVDVTQAPSFEANAVKEFFQTSGRNLMAAEKAAGVKHHLVLTVVGTERKSGISYFNGKAEQEELVRQSGIPYTILHSTQFFEFVQAVIGSATKGNEAHVSTHLAQPITRDEVVAALAELALGSPKKDIEIAGPEQIRLSEFAGYFLSETHDPRKLVADPDALYFGGKIDDQTLMPG